MVDLGTLGGSSSSANGINDLGQIVGESRTASGDIHAFLWENGAIHDLGILSVGFSLALGVNNDGEVAGVSGDDAVRWIVPVAATIGLNPYAHVRAERARAERGPSRPRRPSWSCSASAWTAGASAARRQCRFSNRLGPRDAALRLPGSGGISGPSARVPCTGHPCLGEG
jgi:probable HAF family extracellular repeat protein